MTGTLRSKKKGYKPNPSSDKSKSILKNMNPLAPSVCPPHREFTHPVDRNMVNVDRYTVVHVDIKAMYPMYHSFANISFCLLIENQ